MHLIPEFLGASILRCWLLAELLVEDGEDAYSLFKQGMVLRCDTEQTVREKQTALWLLSPICMYPRAPGL